MKTISIIINALLLLMVMLSVYAMAKITFPFFNFNTEQGFLLTKQNILFLKHWKYSFYFHIATGTIILFTGALQFVPYLRQNHAALHRVSGKIYVFLILAICAPSGFIMGLYANGGKFAAASFMLLSVFWWIFTFTGYRKIRKQNIRAHTAFMIRSYALTLSAITFRTYVMVFPAFTDLHGQPMYILISWLSWLPNMIVAEIILRSGSRPELSVE